MESNEIKDTKKSEIGIWDILAIILVFLIFYFFITTR